MDSLLNHNPLVGIINWFAKARPVPTTKGLNGQMGTHFEEVSEMLAELEGLDGDTRLLIEKAKQATHDLGMHLKSAKDVEVVRIPEANRKGYLDALCDQVVTATGCANDVGFKFHGAIVEVNDSNWSKFVNGEPIFDEGGKIMKGPDYRKADLSPFV